jgi:hypothetical protein
MFAAGLVFSVANVAKADIITVNAVGSPTFTATGSSWTYQATLTTNEELVPGQTEFFTVYGFDFGTDTAAFTGTPTLFLGSSFSSAITPTSTTLTPAMFVTIPQPVCSTPGCYNIRFTYNGSNTIMTTTTPIILGDFTLMSSLKGETPNGFYDGQAMNEQMQTLNGNSGQVGVPSGAPEPMTLGLLGGGLAALGVMRLRKSRKA